MQNIFLFEGYGHITTKSDLGKFITILYAIPSIGVTMQMLVNAGKIMNNITQLGIVFVEKKVLKRSRLSNASIKTFCGQVLFATTLWFVLAAINSMEKAQGQRFRDSVYFIFISLATIGFGDFYFDT